MSGRNKCPACNGIHTQREWQVGRGWEYVECYLCDDGYLNDKELEKHNIRMDRIKNSNLCSPKQEEQGDILYGRGEKWGPV